MNKHLKNYLICWAVIVTLYNIICFVSPETLFGFDKFGGAFWSSYAFAMATLVIHLVFSFVTLNKVQIRESNIIITLGYFEVAIMMTVSALCMFIPNIPTWLGTIICSIVLVFSIIFTVSSKAITENTLAANDALNKKIKLARKLTKDAALLVDKYKGTLNEKDAKKIYDTIRYGDFKLVSQKEVGEYLSLLLESESFDLETAKNLLSYFVH